MAGIYHSVHCRDPLGVLTLFSKFVAGLSGWSLGRGGVRRKGRYKERGSGVERG